MAALQGAGNPASAVFVGNMAYDLSEQDVIDYFSKVGPVKAVRIVTERETGKPRGFGFIDFYDVATAESCIRNLSGSELNGRTIRIVFAEGGPGDFRPRMDERPDDRGPRRPAARSKLVGGDLAYHSSQGMAVLLGSAPQPGAPPDQLTTMLARKTRSELYEYLSQMQSLLRQNPQQARQVLIDNPQLARGGPRGHPAAAAPRRGAATGDGGAAAGIRWPWGAAALRDGPAADGPLPAAGADAAGRAAADGPKAGCSTAWTAANGSSDGGANGTSAAADGVSGGGRPASRSGRAGHERRPAAGTAAAGDGSDAGTDRAAAARAEGPGAGAAGPVAWARAVTAPDEVTFAVMVRGYGDQEPPRWTAISNTVAAMERDFGITPTSRIYNALLEVCARTKAKQDMTRAAAFLPAGPLQQ